MTDLPQDLAQLLKARDEFRRGEITEQSFIDIVRQFSNTPFETIDEALSIVDDAYDGYFFNLDA